MWPRAPKSLLLELIGDTLPADNSKQSQATSELSKLLRQNDGARILDVGCSNGWSKAFMESISPNCEWIGVDISSSPEAKNRPVGSPVSYFDGLTLPFHDETFDVVFCRQTLERAVDPRRLISEMSRVLRKGGKLCGSTSQLEPFHSYSYFNFSAFCLKQLLKESKLRSIVLRPGVDGLSLIVRQGLFGYFPFWKFWYEKESPLNILIELFGRAFRTSRRYRTALKLQFAGVIVFTAKK